jgi:hypothetical protein
MFTLAVNIDYLFPRLVSLFIYKTAEVLCFSAVLFACRIDVTGPNSVSARIWKGQGAVSAKKGNLRRSTENVKKFEKML